MIALHIRAAAVAALALGGPMLAGSASAQTGFPTQPVRIVVGVAPGGLQDIFARLIAPHLQTRLGQPVIVENRLGSGGMIGARSVADARPDGHTLFIASAGTFPSALMHTPPGYTMANFTPVAMMLEAGALLGIRPATGIKTFKELVAYAKANPRKLRYGSSGVGSPTHLSIEYMDDLLGIELTHIPYRGNVAAMTALFQGEVDIAIVNPVGFEKQIRDGQVTVLAQTTRVKISGYDLPALPDVIPGYAAPFWVGLLAPAHTPPEVVGKLNGAVNAVMREAFGEQAAKAGMALMPMTPEKFTDYVKEDTDRWAAVIKSHNIKAE
jgi:tripartite-type tricarboxylate transporter receptor subunit TctC